MSNLVATQYFSAASNAYTSYYAARTRAKMQRDAQQYQSIMQKLSVSRALNAVTRNEVAARDNNIRIQLGIQEQSMQDQARAEVDAAAAGVTGESVAAVMRNLRASATKASYAQRTNYISQLRQMNQQRSDIRFNAILNKDVSVIPMPSVGMALLGAGSQLLSIYDHNRTPSQRRRSSWL